jgi:hypothetical protein
LAVGCWLLAVGCWLLAVGCWLLAVGCWLLEMRKIKVKIFTEMYHLFIFRRLRRKKDEL